MISNQEHVMIQRCTGIVMDKEKMEIILLGADGRSVYKFKGFILSGSESGFVKNGLNEDVDIEHNTYIKFDSPTTVTIAIR